MTRLLVSVRDVSEAVAAFQGGADLIDIKEPRQGSLGAADVATWRAIQTELGARATLSAALGEWHERLLPQRAAQLRGFAYAKLGLAGATAASNWREEWTQLLRQLPVGTAGVAVAYADWQRAAAPEPLEVVRVGSAAGCRVALCDTWHKDGPLTKWWNSAALREWCACARECQLQIALAGSVRLPDLDTLLELQPDWIAVRGAVCAGDRTGPIDGQLVSILARHVKPVVGKIPTPAVPHNFHS